jgi:hypothetical protein
MITDFFGNEITVDSIVVMPNQSWDRYGAYSYYRVIKVNPKMLRVRRIGDKMKSKNRKPYEATVYGETTILTTEEKMNAQMIMHVLKTKPKERA